MTPIAVPETAPLTRGRMTGRAPAAGLRSAPGVSVEWVGPLFRELDALRSDVAGFVGLATRGPVDTAKRLASAVEFDSVYGPPRAGMLLAAAVHGFFANGGTTCWVVRAVNQDDAAHAAAELAAGTGIVFRALNEGTWANHLTVDVQPVGDGLVNVTVVAEDGRREVWRRLDVDGLLRPFGDDDVRSARSASALVTVKLAEHATLPATAARAVLAGGDDGLAGLSPAHLTGDPSTATNGHLHGAALFAEIEEIGQVCVPDLVLREPANILGLPAYGPTALADATAQLVGDCQALGRTALLQHPDPGALCDQVVAWRAGLGSPYAAVYWPWIYTSDPSRPGQVLAVPPCGHVAGIIARSDLAVGPHKPPANEIVVGAVGLTRRVDDDDHGRANDNGVNAIRAVAGRGIRVLGARTTSDDSQWRYVNVRRLVTQVERSVAAYVSWLVFEPHDQPLRDDVERVTRQFLDEIWRSGGLEGSRAEDAYTVQVDSPETAAAVGEGALVVEIGLQPPYPAEFVVVRIDVPDLGAADRTGGGGVRGRDR